MNTSTSPQSILSAYEKIDLNSANEATTRLKVIDRIIKEILGWTEDDINVEENVSEDGITTYADYILTTANLAIVIEAKKVGVVFDLLDKEKRKQKLTNAFVSGELGKAIIQARDYARKLSISFAAITNGNTWIVFPAQRHDQVTFNDSFAIIFPSLRSILKDDYQEFVDLLSRDSIVDGSLEAALIGRAENQFGSRKLRNAFVPTTRTSTSNPIYPLIEQAVVTAFSDSISDLDGSLLQKCYVTTPETIKFDNRINLQISKREQLFAKHVTRPLKSSESDVFKRKLIDSTKNIKPLAILLLGSVGAGKTTFLNYTRKVKVSSYFEKKPTGFYPHWIYVDFRDCEDPSKSAEFIYDKIKEYFLADDYFTNYERSIAPAYKTEIDALKAGPLFLISKDEEKFNNEVIHIIKNDYEKGKPYVDKLIKYTAKHCSVFLVIDNVDQIESEENQSKLFAETIAIGHKLGVNLVISIRGTTYAKHKNSATFDAFDFDPLLIDAPKISSVLSKRFALAKQLLSNKSGHFTAKNGAHIHISNLANIMDLVQSSVLGTEIGSRIEVLSTEDVRLALRMTREFLEYGYTDPGKAWQTYKSQGNYVMPQHEAFRAILLGNRRDYSEEFSPIANPFDSKLSITAAQLLRLYILTAIVNFASSQSFRHIDGTEILENMRKIGFGDQLVLRTLQDLCKHRLLNTASHNEPDLQSSFFPTRLGGYIVRDLIAYFSFIENVMFDTFISDNSVWENLRAISHQVEGERNLLKRVKLRVNRVEMFISHLKNLYSPLQQESQKRGLVAEWCSNPFDDTEGMLNTELQRVMISANKNYGANSRVLPEDIDEI